MTAFLFSYQHGAEDYFPTRYRLVYAETQEQAKEKLKSYFTGKIYAI